MAMRDKRTLCSTLWLLVKSHQGKGEHYYDEKYLLQADKVDEVLRIFKNGVKIVGYNSEWGVLNWFGDEKDFDQLWDVISKHDEMYGFEWHLR